MHKVRKYRHCAHKDSAYRLKEPGEWQPHVVEWAEHGLLFNNSIALADGEVDAVLRVLEGVKD